MHSLLKSALALCAAALAGHAAAHATFYEHDRFGGRSFTLDDPLVDFQRAGFNDRASSVVVVGEPWEVCEHAGFSGRCAVLQPGRYPSLRDAGLNDQLSSARAARRHDDDDGDGRPPVRPGRTRVTLFEHPDFRGRSFTANDDVANFVRIGFNDRATSLVVVGGPWEVCEHVRYEGRCTVLRPGRYPDLRVIGLDDQLSSVRIAARSHRFDGEDEDRPSPRPPHDWRRLPRERIYEAEVTDVRAVYAEPQRRCWVEREQVSRQPNAAGAVIGGVLGGIIGHQVGGQGGSRDIATVGGAVAGAAIGSQVGRGNTSRDVERCDEVPSREAPAFWDVTYRFRGVEHHVQARTPPGRTVTVNAQGEPRE